ncbi:T9SS type B sorting domain-containing protein [Flavobacterium sp. DG1-102-2]|uniref:T9SS type B sorting domain-containing protein n=1 Tax=Flavobacterium sp. DG1-102-2 TaxID=3081663 RepID=UPI00294A3D52|nr:T9SS type B sorting domain-containing protein [Flavobacterium sp. DG1-102-2]MDV6168037.1 T9SS type B sorting domain-containing protein [Flavobacterium sp. DG1-102-2]
MKFKLTFMLLLCSILSVFAQSDCTDAITVCGNTGYAGLTAAGTGNSEELTFGNNDCEGVETNSLWLRLPIHTGGTLGFILTPSDPDIIIDFDFYIFGPNASCNNLGHAIRCSTTNPDAANSASNITGLNETETDFSEGPGFFGNNFVQWLTVNDGDVYFLVIDRPIGASDFSIEWTGTATFNEAPVFNNPQAATTDIVKCDDDAVDDQITAFDLTINQAMLLNNQFDAVLTYHENINDATLGINAIEDPTAYTNTSNPQTLYMRLHRESTECFEVQDFTIEVTNPIVAGDPDDLEQCDLKETGRQVFDLSVNNSLLQNGNTETAVTYYTSQANAQLKFSALPEQYETATATIWARVESTGQCQGSDITSFQVSVTPLPVIGYTLDVDDFTANDNSITVVMPDAEEYEFSINGGSYSDNNSFRGLEAGPYTISIRAKSGCKTVSEDVVILNYPRFFSPNNDGKNDVWRIPYLSLQPQAEVTIYDRYGKVLGGFKGSNGWDGLLNDRKLPATDYWFVLQLDSGRIIKGHFAMIR